MSTSKFSAIPGTQATLNGYDNELGTDAICWKSVSVDRQVDLRFNTTSTSSSSSTGDEEDSSGAIFFPNPLVEDFVVSPAGVELLRACPQGNNLTARAPNLQVDPLETEFFDDPVLRTGQFYNFTVSFHLNMTSLGATEFISKPQPNLVAVQVLLCVAGVSGFCTPFVHEQANFRLQSLDDVPEIGDLHGQAHVHSPFILVELPASEGPVYQRTIQVPMRVNWPGEYYAISALHFFFASPEDDESNVMPSAMSSDLMSSHGAVAITTVTEKEIRQLQRFDMANALVRESRLLMYYDTPTVFGVSTAVRNFCYASVALASFILGACLVELVRHRKHNALQLSQGHWLARMCLASLIATLSTVLLEPESDLYCRLSFPILLTSLQLMFAIAAGRIWRVNLLLSPTLKQAVARYESRRTSFSAQKSARFVISATQSGWKYVVNRITSSLCGCSSSGCAVCCQWIQNATQGESKKKTVTVTNADLLRVVVILCLPQLVLQMLSVLVDPRELTVELKDDFLEGRFVCSTELNSSSDGDDPWSLFNWGFYCLGGIILLLLQYSYRARDLPSLLNETQQIWNGTAISGVLLMIGVVVIVVSGDQPSASPGIRFLILTMVVFFLTLNMTLRIVLPPLLVVYKGETILVSQLVHEHVTHHRKLQEQKKKKKESNQDENHHHIVHVSGLEGPPPAASQPTSKKQQLDRLSSSEELEQRFGPAVFSNAPMEINRQSRGRRTHYAVSQSSKRRKRRPQVNTITNEEFRSNHSGSNIATNVSKETHEKGNSGMDAPSSVSATTTMHKPTLCHGFTGHKFSVFENKPPRQVLLMTMLEVQENLHLATKRLLCGHAISPEEWEEVAALSIELGCIFHERVEFAWQHRKSSSDDDCGPTLPSAVPFPTAQQEKEEKHHAMEVHDEESQFILPESPPDMGVAETDNNHVTTETPNKIFPPTTRSSSLHSGHFELGNVPGVEWGTIDEHNEQTIEWG